MALNVRRIAVATVPLNLPINGHKLTVRGIATSRMLAADIRYGLTQSESNATFPMWEDAYTIGVRLTDETSVIYVDGRAHAQPQRKGQSHLLYLSGVDHIDLNTPRHTLETLLPRTFIREIADDLEVPHVTSLGRDLFHVTDDPVLERLALRIHPFFDAPETLDPLLADHYMWSLGIYVCAYYGGLEVRRPAAGGLSTWQERLAKEVIETSLVGGIGLAELATICGLRTSQFSHAFERSTGVAPYQWLLRRRISRATDLLANTNRSLADVAVESGFADQSHLTRSFARQVGATPAAWRAAFH